MAAGVAGEPVGVGEKDPDAVLNYSIDWTDWLDGLSLGGSSWTRATGSTGITVDASTYTTTKATLYVSGGTAGETYRIINHITTSTSTGARKLTQQRSIQVDVLER